MQQAISPADLIVNADGSIYHLNLLPEDLAPLVITVGDPDRVNDVSKHFDRIELKKGKREFITHTGYIGVQRVSVISTGIGTDNIDIVLNELDALVNIDLEKRIVKNELTSIKLVRIGTSGAIQPDIPMGTILASSHAIGLDALMFYYKNSAQGNEDLQRSIEKHFLPDGTKPYLTAAAPDLLKTVAKGMQTGITATAPGFYAPQGRNVRATPLQDNFIKTLNSFRHKNLRITNLEMETAGIYALAGLLGHRAVSVNAILASRVGFQFSKEPKVVVDKAIKLTLDNLF